MDKGGCAWGWFTIDWPPSFNMRVPSMQQMSLPNEYKYVKGSVIVGAVDHQRENKRAGKAGGAQPTPSGDGWKGFVNVELTDAQKPLVKASLSDPDRLWGVIWDLIDGGYKLTISNDATHNSYNVSMTCRKMNDLNNGLTLTGRGGTVLGAVGSFVFKHSVLLEGDWTAGNTASRGRADEDFLG